MNSVPPLDWGIFIVPALAGVVALGLAGAAEVRCASGRRQRMIWLVAFAALGWFLLGLGAGADRWLCFARSTSPPAPRVFQVRATTSQSETISLSPTATIPAPRKSETGAVIREWWPAWLWLGGTLLLWGRQLLRQLWLPWRIRRARQPARPELQRRVAALAARLGLRRRVRVFTLPGLLSPMVWGFQRPVLMAPGDFETAYEERQQDAMLLHELAHLAVHDPAWHTVARGVTAALWWHPLAWWGWRRLRAASEIAADEASVLAQNGPSELAACLVALGDRLRRQRAGWLGIEGGGFRSGLGRRVQRLLALSRDTRPWRVRRGGNWGLVAGAAALAGLLLAGLLLAGTARVWSAPEPRRLAGTSWIRQAVAQAALIVFSPPDAASAPASPPRSAGAEKETPSPESSSPAAPNAAAARAKATHWATRLYRLNPPRLIAGLKKLGFHPETNGIPTALRNFLATAGVDWGGTNQLSGNGFRGPDGKAMFFRLDTGSLLVRATDEDLARIEQALAMTAFRPPALITIKTLFVELSEKALGALDLEEFFRSSLMAANAPSPPPVTATATNGPAAIPAPRRGDTLDWVGRHLPGAKNLRVQAVLSGRLEGVLTPAQFRSVLQRLKQEDGANLMFAPVITTVSGRQAQIQSVELRSIATRINPAALATSAQKPPDTNVPPFLTQQIPVGPALDVLPAVENDAGVLDLSIEASVTEFLGYQDAPAESRVLLWIEGKPTRTSLPLPCFQVRQARVHARLKDGYTAVLSGMAAPGAPDLSSSVSRARPRFPVRGPRKHLLIFVTAVLVDPAGHPLHPEE